MYKFQYHYCFSETKIAKKQDKKDKRKQKRKEYIDQEYLTNKQKNEGKTILKEFL
jgi:hypothetical protein